MKTTGISRRDFLRGTSGALALTLVGLDGCKTVKEVRVEKAVPNAWTASVCPYCGVGCGIEVGTRDGQVLALRGMERHPVNRGRICLLGSQLASILSTDDRLLKPMIRSGEVLQEATWDDAIGRVASGVQSVIDEHGPDAFAMYVSASEYLEEYYVYNKFVKGCLGTNNLESSARLCWASGVVGLVKAFGADAPPCAYEDLELADLFVVAGYNLAASKPVLFKRLVEARAKSSAKLIVIDPRRTDTAAQADLHLRVAPGSDVAVHNGIAHVLFGEGLVNDAEARRLTDDLDALKAHVAAYPPSRVAELAGISTEEIVQAARMIGKANAALFLWGQGLNQSRVGARKVSTLLNLVFVTGNVGKPGAGPLAIGGQCSAMGLREVGALPHLLPGFRVVTDPKARADIEGLWGVPKGRISAKKGLTIGQTLEGIEAGKIKALWVIHSNPAATFPDTNWVRKTLAKLDLLIVQDCHHPTETSQYAHVLLPAAQWAEKSGTITNSERGLNLAEAAVKPPGEARSDRDIVLAVGRKMGFEKELAFADDEAIFQELKRCTEGRPNDIRGVTYARLRKEPGIQWPVPTADHPGTKRRFIDGDFPRGKLNLGRHEHLAPAETPSPEYPLTLITGLIATQFHSRTRTAKVPALQRSAPDPYVEMHPDDAQRLKIAHGQAVTVSTRRASLSTVARVTDSIRPGSIFVPYHYGYLHGGDGVNALTNRAFDEVAGQPEYKACAAAVRPA